jgi:hypothetical protein
MAGTEAAPLTSPIKSALTLCVLLALVGNWLPQLDVLAQTYLSDTIGSNVIVFGVVRTLNGVISIVQSAEVGVGIAGVGIGEIFDPVNDLIERFSGLLLVTLTALGIQQVILLFTTSLAMKILFTLFAGVVLLLLWWKPMALRFWLHLALVIFLLRFLLSLQVGFVWIFDQLYFNATGEEALSVLEASAQVIQTIKDSITDINISQLIFGDRTPALSSEDIGTRLSTSVVTLIVGMLFKSVFIPLGTLWFGYKVSKQLLLTAKR